MNRSLLLVWFFATLVLSQKTCPPYDPSEYVKNFRVPPQCKPEVLSCTRSWKSGIPLGASTDLPLIDSDFILCHEGFYTCGYVPIDPDTGKVLGGSGVHIGGGVDLGVRDRAGLDVISVPLDIINILDLYLQVKSDDAACAVINIPFSLSNSQATTLTDAVINSIVSLAQVRYDTEQTVGTSFISLPKGIRTAIVDIWYHLGPPENYPAFWSSVIVNDWDRAVVELQGYYTSPTPDQILDVRRRYDEADIINAALEECTTSADVVFLLDESGSISSSDFTLALNFTQQIINAFPDETLADPKGTRFGLSVFGSSYRREFNLLSNKNKTAYTNALSSVVKMGGGTYLGAALNEIINSQFTESNGLRPESLGFPKILVVLTDGRATDAVVTPSQNVRDRNIVIYAIGIGGYDLTQLNSIASSPSMDYIYLLTAFADLSGFASTLTASTCYQSQPISFNLTITGQIKKDEFQYFEFQVSITDNLLVVVIDFIGGTLLFASRDTQHPYEFDNDFGFLSSSSSRKEIVISPLATNATTARRRRDSHANVTFPVYVSVKGTSSSNTFVLTGNPCDPAVCKQGASGAGALQESVSVLVLLFAILLSF